MFNHEIICRIEALLADNDQLACDIAHKYNFSGKKLRYEINRLNAALKTIKVPTFSLVKGRLVIPEYLEKKWPYIKKTLSRKEVFIRKERLFVIILYLFMRQEQVSGQHLQNLLQLSKNSVLEEVKKLKIYVKDYQVELQYSRKIGYHFVGNEKQIRQLAENAINKLLQLSTGEWALNLVFTMWGKKLNIIKLKQKLQYLSNSLQVKFVEKRLLEILYLLAFIRERKTNFSLIYSEETLQEIKKQPLYKIGQTISDGFVKGKNRHEATYITIRLLGAMQSHIHLVDNCGLGDITEQIIRRVQALIGTEFHPLECFKEALFEHLVPAYFRIAYDIRLENPYIEQIKIQYEELFYLVEKGLVPFAEFLGKKIPENEVAYFTIHFGGQLKQNTVKKYKQLRALVICPNGISSSLILTSNLKEIFPMISFHRIQQVELITEISQKDYDMIFSTSYCQTTKNLYITKPILNYIEVQMLKAKVFRDFALSECKYDLSVYDILEVVGKHSDIKNEQALVKELSMRMLGANFSLNKEKKSLPQLLSKEFIKLVDQQYDWQEAIAIASQPLLMKGYITSNYISAMIRCTKKAGEYIVLAPKVAIPHARPEAGVKKLGFSLLRLSQPVNFNLSDKISDECMVQLIFVLATIDNVSHLTALKQLAQILERVSTINQMIKATSVDELHDILHNNL